MSKHAEELTTQESLLTERICRALTRCKIPFEREALCEFGPSDWGFIDIFIKSVPVRIIEVKGANNPHRLYTAIGQLLSYSACFPDAILYLAVPNADLVPKRVLAVIERAGIRMWTGSYDDYAIPSTESAMVNLNYCEVCDHPARSQIESAMKRGVKLAVIATQRRLPIEALSEHQAHAACDSADLSVIDASNSALTQVTTTHEPTEIDSHIPNPDNAMIPMLEACGEAISLGSQRLANCERFLVAIMDRLEQVLGNEAGVQERDMHDAEKAFQQAWQDMKDEPARQQRMILWLNEVLQRDDMGL